MGNGYPVACFGGRADGTDVIGSGGGVVHGGTYTINLVALSAANAHIGYFSQYRCFGNGRSRWGIHQGWSWERIHQS